MCDRRSFMLKALGMGAALSTPGWARAFIHPLDQPALQSLRVAHSPLLGVTRAGEGFVAVGQRGQIVISDDKGQTWVQAKVPVSSDLVALSFPTDKEGWAVGHGGAVLHTKDGGVSWIKQFDGRQASRIALDYYAQLDAADPEIARLIDEERFLAESGGLQPFLDVYFESASSGYIVGTFNRIFHTEDGGANWLPWMHRTDNPGGLHFNAVKGHNGAIYLAGEQGTVWRLDSGGERFSAFATSYEGTLFGLLSISAGELLAFGMRGSAFHSEDAGASWQRIEISSQAGITGGTVLADGTVALVTQAGGIDISRDHGRTFSPFKPEKPMSYYGVAAGPDGRLVLAGAEGMRTERVR